MPKPRRRDDRSTTPGFIRRRNRRGQNEAYVFDLTEDRYVEVSDSGRVSDKRLGLTEIPVEVAEDVYDDEDLDDAE